MLLLSENSLGSPFTHLAIWLVFFILGSSVASLLIGKNANAYQRSLYWVASLGITPLVLASLYVLLLTVMPRASYTFYASIILSVVSTLFFASIFKKEKARVSIRLFPKERFDAFISLILFCLIIAIFFTLFKVTLDVPLFANDPLEYGKVASVIHYYRDTSIYPIIDNNTANGFYGAWTHGLGFIGIQALLKLFLSGEFVAKTVSLYYFFITSLLIIFTFPNRARMYGVFSAVVYIASPLLVDLAVINHIDHVRISMFFLAFICLGMFITNRTNTDLVFFGITVGLALFTHSIGILVLPILAVIVLFNVHLSIHNKLYMAMAAIVGSLVFWGGALLRNIKVIGSLAADGAPLWKLEHLNFNFHFQVYRGIEHHIDIILNGVFKPFYNFQHFGLVYFAVVFILSVMFYLKKHHFSIGFMIEKSIKFIFYPKNPVQVLGLGAVGFYSIYLITIALDMSILVKNNRYLMTIQPFIATLAGFLGWSLVTKVKKIIAFRGHSSE